MSNMSSGTGASHKKVVYLRSFSLSTAEDKSLVEACIAALLKKGDQLVANKDVEKIAMLVRSPEAILDAMNDDSSECQYYIWPGGRSEMFSSFLSYVEPGFKARLLERIDNLSDEYKRETISLSQALIDSNYTVDSVNLADKFNLSQQTNRGDIEIGFCDASQKRLIWCSVPGNVPLKALLRAYAAEVGVPLGSMWFEHKGKPLFLSNLRSATAAYEHVMDGGAIINVNHRQPRRRTPLKAVGNIEVESQQTRRKKKSRNKPKKKCGNPAQQAKTREVEEEEELHKKDLGSWMDSISSVFAEAKPLFKSRREKIHELGLKRTVPKLRKKSLDPLLPSAPDCHLFTDRLGSKAGKSCFIVRVGDEANLYKTTKSSKIVGHSSANDLATVDLHGLAREEALGTLDGYLPRWIDTAMKGSYPWVVTVKIVCGGGGQVLAQTVEKWIRQNRQVCRAPKSVYL